MLPPLPDNFAVGSSIAGADCFFHCIVQTLQQSTPVKTFSVKSVRLQCKEFAKDQLSERHSWLREVLEGKGHDNDNLQKYAKRVGFSSGDIATDKAKSLNLPEAIWGRPEIEGRIVCNVFNVKLHVIQKGETEDEALFRDKDARQLWQSMLVDKSGCGSVDHVDFEAKDTIHLLQQGQDQFKPILRCKFGDNSSDGSDEEETSRKLAYELSRIVRNRRSEKEKVKEIRILLDKGANINFRDRNDRCNTVLHVAIRKGDLEVARFLVENSADVHVKNIENRSALELAMQIKRQDIVHVLNGTNKETVTLPNRDVMADRPRELLEKTTFRFKRPTDDSGASGQRYEVNLLTLFKLRGEHLTSDFHLAGNLHEAGDFDDVVFKYRDEYVSKTIFLQAKHRQDTGLRKISRETFTTDKDFDLQKYFKSYLGIKEQFGRETESPIFKGGYETANCEFVLLTNASLGSDRNSLILQEPTKGSFQIGKGGKAVKLDPDYGLECLTSKEHTEYVHFLSKKFIDFVLSSKKDSVMASDEAVKEYHVLWAQRVLDVLPQIHSKPIRRLKPGQKEIRFRNAKISQNFTRGPIDNSLLREFRNEVTKALEKLNLHDKVITVPEEFGNIGPTVNLINAVETLCEKFVELVGQTRSENTCIIPKVTDKKLFKDLGKLVGNVFVLNENTGFFKLNDKQLEGDAKEVLDRLVDAINRKSLDPRIDFDFQIVGFPKLSLKYKSKLERQQTEFINRLTIYTDQPSVKELDEIIKQETKTFYQLTDREVELNSLKINDRMTKYWLETGSVAFLRKGDAFFSDIKRDPINFCTKLPIDSFTGRVKALQLLHESLQSDKQVVVISGLGGIGKSELARKYASDYGQCCDNNVVWIDAENSITIQQSFVKLCQNALNIPVHNGNGSLRKMRYIYEDIHRFFEFRKSLIIFDNAESLPDNERDGKSEIEKFLAPLWSGKEIKMRIIVTSRSRNWKFGKLHALDTFSDDEGEQFVKSFLKICDSQDGDVKSLISLLQNFPLALQQAVAYIREKDADCRIFSPGSSFRIADYLKLHEEKNKEMMNFKFPEDSLDYYTSTTYKTWNITIETIKLLNSGKEAVEIINIIAYCNPNNVPVNLFLGTVGDNVTALNRAVTLLKQYSLIALDQGMVSIHRLVQSVTRIKLREEQKEEMVLREALSLLIASRKKKKFIIQGVSVWNYASIYPDLVTEFRFIPHQIITALMKDARYQEAFSFGRGSLELLNSNPVDIASILLIDESFATTIFFLGEYKTSLELLSAVLETKSRILGHDHPLVLRTQSNIAHTLNKQGKYEEALSLYEEVLEKSNKTFGPDHPLTTDTEHNFAELLYNQGKYNEALKMFTQVVEKRTKILGPDHKLTLRTQQNIAQIMADLCKPEAVNLNAEVFEKMTKRLGSGHIDTLNTQSNNALMLLDQYKYDEALNSLKDVFRKKSDVFGSDHPETQIVQNNIAHTLSRQGNYPEALSHYKEVLEKQMKTLGPDHQLVLTVKQNISTLLSNMGKPEAVKSFKEVLEKETEKMGSDHPDTITTQIQVAQVLTEHGKHAEALLYNANLVEKCTDILGPEHRLSLIAEYQVANTMYHSGKYEEASRSYVNLLDKSTKTFGIHDQLTLNIQHNLALTMSEQGKYEEALRISKELLEKRIETLGPEHPDTLTLQNNNACILCELGKYDESLSTSKYVLEKRIKILGPDHPNTLASRSIAARVLNRQGKHDEALRIFREIYHKFVENLGPDHPFTVTTQNNIAETLSNLREYDEAFKSTKEVFEKRIKLLGTDHPDTLITQHSMAQTLFKLGKHDEALNFYKEVLEKRITTLGHDHPYTLTTRNNIAQVMSNQGKHEEALNTLKEVLQKRVEILGANHPDTLTTQHNIAETLSKMDKYEEALCYYKEVFEKRTKVLGAEHPHTLDTERNMVTLSNRNKHK